MNNTFIWDLEMKIIRESKFTFPAKRQDLQVDIFGTPSLSMFRTFDFAPGMPITAPAYFVSNAK